MNGETQIILERLTKIETQQKERHRENKEARKEVLATLKPLVGVPISIKWLTWSTFATWGVVGTVLFIWVKMALAK